MQTSYLPGTWLKIIEHSIFLLDSLGRRVLALMEAHLSLLLGRKTFFQVSFKTLPLDKLFNVIFAPLEKKSLDRLADIYLLPEIQLKLGNHCIKNTCVAYVSSTTSSVQ
ncbi:hypothetical protein [Calothrix sp. NIES-2098]|uniref:hypothetical protein n=1 Tax=Calothrix sp. NIES-2098 TaxID=1954171 RepID=UPI0030DDB522